MEKFVLMLCLPALPQDSLQAVKAAMEQEPDLQDLDKEEEATAFEKLIPGHLNRVQLRKGRKLF